MLLAINFTTPFDDPVLKFLVLLAIILLAPLLLNKIKVPSIIGLIIAGALVGPNGFNILPRDQNVVVTGTTGLLYIMFLAGLEIDLGDFKKNSSKSGLFGMLTFLIPMILGTFCGYYILNFGLMSSILFASLMASHTLLSYPIISKLGVAKNLAVNVSVGGTMITDVLALLVLAVIVGMTQGEVNAMFWTKMGISLLVFGIVVLYGFPILGRIFFKKVNDKTSQYLFVLAIVFLGALMAELAGVEAIIGAFFAGLALNRLIPHTSTLMNRIEFVGNAYFIPFFLISVGMLIDYKAFIQDTETIIVAIVMTIVVVIGKYLAAWITSRFYGFSSTQKNVIFGLSVAQAAATLAAVLVGYNIVIGETELGQPIRLLSGSVLNGSILMILISCTVSSIISQKNAEKLAKEEENGSASTNNSNGEDDNILCLLGAEDNSDRILELAINIKENGEQIVAMSVTNDESSEDEIKSINKTLDNVSKVGSTADVAVETVRRHDANYVSAIKNVTKEKSIKDIILAMGDFDSSNYYSNLLSIITEHNNKNVFIHRIMQPVGTLNRCIIVVDDYISNDENSRIAIMRLLKLVKNFNASAIVYGNKSLQDDLIIINESISCEYQFKTISSLNDFLIVTRDIENDTCLMVLLDRNKLEKDSNLKNIPQLIKNYIPDTSYLIYYPISQDNIDSNDYSISKNLDTKEAKEFLEIGKTITGIFQNKN